MARPASASLTQRQREVLRLHRAGLSPRQIAERLGVSAATVREHLMTALSRLEGRRPRLWTPGPG
jgi:RNA polymerase sigma factor (sigma-70 family)